MSWAVPFFGTTRLILPTAEVLLVPGLGLGTETWLPLLDALDEAGTLDRALMTTALVGGYGRPAGRDESLAPDVLARRVLDRGVLGEDCVVIALSAGCQVAAHIARLAPDRVVGVVLIGPTTDPRAGTWCGLVGRWLRTAWFEPKRQIPVLLRQYRRTGLSTMVRALERARHDRIDAVLDEVRCPILVVRGAHDHISPKDWTESLARVPASCGGAAAPRESVTLTTGAHMVPYTHGGAVARIVCKFLAQIN